MKRLGLPALLLLILISAAGLHYFKKQMAVIGQQVESDLLAISELKTRQIIAWRDERYSDAGMLTDSPFLAEAVERWRAHPTPLLTDQLRQHLQALKSHYGYHDVLLADPEGRIAFSLSGAVGELPVPARAPFRRAIDQRQQVMTDIHTGPAYPFAHFGLIAPLFADDRPLGAVLLIINAQQYLEPLIQRWPTPSRSAETLLVQRDGDAVRLIASSRKGVPADLRIPLTRIDIPAVRAVLGESGLFHGTDYRGQAVVAAAYPVPGTAWHLLAKIDADELFAGLRKDALQVGAALQGGLGLLGGVLYALWQRQRREEYRKLLALETARHASEGRFHTLFESMPDPAWIIVENRFVEANAAALKALGYAEREALLGRHPAELSPERQLDGESSGDKAERIFAAMANQPVQRFEWVHQRRDGSLLPVEVTLTAITWEGLGAQYCVWRDLSERQALQAAKAANEARFQTLFNGSNEAILLYSGDAFIDCNLSAMALYGYPCRADLLSTHPADLSPPQQPDGRDSRAAADAYLREALATGHCHFEWEHCKADGTPFTAAVSLSAIQVGEAKILQAIVSDITERKRAEQQLHLSQFVLERIMDAVYWIRPDSSIFYVNAAASRMLGYSLDELTHMRVVDLDPNYPLDQWREHWAELEEGQAKLVETTHRTRDGRLIPIEVSANYIRYEDQEYNCAIVRDISARKAAEQELQQAADRYRKILSATKDSFWLVDEATGRLLDVNEAAVSAGGFTRDELLSMHILDLDVVYGPEDYAAQMAKIMSLGWGLFETRHRTKDGRIIDVEVSTLPDESTHTLVAFIRDITERKALARKLQETNVELEQRVAARTAELRARTQELQTSEERFQMAMDASRDGLWDWRINTGKVYYSPGFCKLLGFVAGALPGRVDTWLSLLHPEERQTVWKAQTEAMQTAGQFEMEFRMRTQAGEWRWILSRGRVVERTPEGLPLRAVGTMVDITDRKQAEQAIRDLNATLEERVARRTRELEAASAAKSQFLAHMSHEIRTPMNAIIGLTQVLERAALPEEERDLVRRIGDAGESLLNIINDILDFSKIEAGQLSLERRPFTVAEVLTRLENLLATTAERKGVAFRTTARELTGAYLGDPLRLEQILINLAGNAIKFTEQGQVEISVAPVSRSAEAARLRFEVRDTGIGIPPAALAQLFQPFTQGDASITRRFGGTGLGLVIARRLVELMGGRIGATSVEQSGSTFWFEIPFDLASAPALLPAPEPAPAPVRRERLAGLRVLAVDDNRINLLVVEKALQLEGARVDRAGHGQEALDRLQAQPLGYDVVLMDIQMPVMDGLSATRAIRARADLANLPVVALSAGVLPEEREAALAAGVNDFLPKPLEIERMVAVLRPFLGAVPAAG